jgi:hypothetical protein
VKCERERGPWTVVSVLGSFGLFGLELDSIPRGGLYRARARFGTYQNVLEPMRREGWRLPWSC